MSPRTGNLRCRLRRLSKRKEQVFARKFIRVAGQVNEQTVLDAGHIIDVLRTPGHENLVQVLYHGWLPQDSSFYFIDMERCLYDLDQYIQEGSTQLSQFMSEDGSETQFLKRFRFTMDIAKQIANGLAYMHARNEIHRDLKPRNGRSFGSFNGLPLFSTLFGGFEVEDC